MVQSATDTRSLQMNNMNNTTASCFPYVTYTQRNANKSEYNTRPHEQQRQRQQQAVHANIRNSNSYSANNSKNYSTSLPAARAITASIVGTGKTNTNRSNSHADKTKRNNSSTKINNLTEIKKTDSNVEVYTTATKGEKQEEQKEELKRNSVEEQEQYHVSKTTSNTEIDWLRRSTLQRQRDEMDKAHHLQFLKLCGKIGPKPWRHSTVAEQKDMSALGNENNQHKKSNSKEGKEELSSLMSCDAFCSSSPSSLSFSSSSSASLLPLCNTNRISRNNNNCKKKEKKKNRCINTNKGKDEPISKKKLADVDATDEDVYELVYGVGTCGYLQQLTQRAQRKALPSTNYNSTTNNNNDKEESDHNTNNNATTLTAISANKQDKPLPVIQGDKRKKNNVFDRLRHGNKNKRNTYMILNADNNNNKKREETLPPLALSRADHPLSMQPTPQGASTTSESTLGPTSSASPESSSSLMHEASMYVAPPTDNRNSLNSVIVGGQMDVFGYFATHRVFPHYYDTLQTRFYSTRIA